MDKDIDNNKYVATKKVGIAGIVGNIFLLIIKLTIGIISKSQALIADGLNSAGDIFASGMTYIGNKIASQPSDEDHNYGHGKAEYIFSLLISISMIVFGFKILTSSFNSIINKEYFIFSYWLVVVCLVTIISKIGLYIFAKTQGEKYNSLLILSNSKDHINDVFVTTSTLIGILVAKFLNIYWLDGCIGICISLWICYTGYTIFIQGYKILMDTSISKELKEIIIEIITKYKEINHVDSITSKPVGTQYLIVIKVSIDGESTINESHEVVSKLKHELLNLEDVYDVIIHVNPC